MGASDFFDWVPRTDPNLTMKQAFTKLRDEALYEEGHNGHTGTIADKSEVKAISLSVMKKVSGIETLPTTEKLATAVASDVLDSGLPFSDKWGPCWAIEVVGPNAGWLFFGVSPS